ncbi:hypothetical protein [Sulfurospirillum sp. UCH001]|uniref:hypothetical protein n=1 Tax=Sulfurospirillum sp. UCH001 TaxID=1581011 RepID=UPI000831CCEA|nr:hypothetical protein [Sulfurospirillum sp. UCH001]
MDYQRIANYKLMINSQLQDGIGVRNFKKFFEIFIEKFAQKSTKYFDITDDLLYIYREKQLNTVIAPILDEIATAFLCEYPTERKFSKKESDKSHGWIDYWVKDNSTIYLIELKHSYNGLQNDDVLKSSAIHNWKTAVDQLIQVKNDKNFTLNNENVLKIALIVVVTITSSKKKIVNNEEKCEKIQALLVKELNLKNSFIVANLIPCDTMCKLYKYADGEFSYPYIHIVAQIIK